MPQHRLRDFEYGTWDIGTVSRARVMMRCASCREQITNGDMGVKLYPTVYKNDRGFPFPRLHCRRACLENYIRLLREVLDNV